MKQRMYPPRLARKHTRCSKLFLLSKAAHNDVEPNWELTVSLLQSLRKLRSQWSPPRPAIAPVDSPIATFAGPRAMNTSQMQETEQKYILCIHVSFTYVYANSYLLSLICICETWFYRSSLFDTLLGTARHLDTVHWLVFSCLILHCAWCVIVWSNGWSC